MTTYTVTYAGRETPDGHPTAEPFSAHVYEVLRDGEKVVELGHDYRGDEHWIRKPGGFWQDLPRRVITGGGPQPLALSREGILAVEGLGAKPAPEKPK